MSTRTPNYINHFKISGVEEDDFPEDDFSQWGAEVGGVQGQAVAEVVGVQDLAVADPGGVQGQGGDSVAAAGPHRGVQEQRHEQAVGLGGGAGPCRGLIQLQGGGRGGGAGPNQGLYHQRGGDRGGGGRLGHKLQPGRQGGGGGAGYGHGLYQQRGGRGGGRGGGGRLAHELQPDGRGGIEVPGGRGGAEAARGRGGAEVTGGRGGGTEVHRGRGGLGASRYPTGGAVHADLDDMDPDAYLALHANANSKKNEKFAVDVFDRVMGELSERNGEQFESLQEASVERLPYLLQKFLQTATKVGGQVYSSGSLNTLVNSISNFLKSREVDPVDVKYDFRFKKVHEMLRVQTRVSASEGRGTGCNAKRPVTQAHLAAALEIGSIGRNGPKPLATAAYFTMVMGMGCRTGAECYMIRNGDLTFGPLSERGVPQWIELAERITKTRKGNQGDERELTPRVFPDDEYPETCYVRTLVEYQKRKTPAQLKPDSPFFLTVNQRAVQDPGRYQYWYYNGIMGVHTVKTLFTDALELAGIDCKVHKYSAISLRKSMLQSGVDCGVPDMHLSRLAGHKSLVSKKDYIRSAGAAHKASSLVIRRNFCHNVNKGYDEEMRNLNAGNKDDSVGSRPEAKKAVRERSRESGRSRSGDKEAIMERSRSEGRERSRSEADGTGYKRTFGNRGATGERSRSRSRSWKAGTERGSGAGGADREMSKSRSREPGRERKSCSGEAGRDRRRHWSGQDGREPRRSDAGEAGWERRSEASGASRERSWSEAGVAGRMRSWSDAGEAGRERSWSEVGERERYRPRRAGWERSLSRSGGDSGMRLKFGGFGMDQERSGECDQWDGRESGGWGGGMIRRELGSREDSEYRREHWGSCGAPQSSDWDNEQFLKKSGGQEGNRSQTWRQYGGGPGDCLEGRGGYGARREAEDRVRDRRKYMGQEEAMTWRVSQNWGDIRGAWEEKDQEGGRSWREAKGQEDKGYWREYGSQEESMPGRRSGDWEEEQPWKESCGWEDNRRKYGGWGEGVRNYGGWGQGGMDYAAWGEGGRDYEGWGEAGREHEGCGEGRMEHGGWGEGWMEQGGWGEGGMEQGGLGEGGRESGGLREGGREPGGSKEDHTASESLDEDRRVSESWEEDKRDLELDNDELMQSQQALSQAEARQNTAEISCPEEVCKINMEIKRLQEKILALQRVKDRQRGEEPQNKVLDTAQDLQLGDGLISSDLESQVGLNCLALKSFSSSRKYVLKCH